MGAAGEISTGPRNRSQLRSVSDAEAMRAAAHMPTDTPAAWVTARVFRLCLALDIDPACAQKLVSALRTDHDSERAAV